MALARVAARRRRAFLRALAALPAAGFAGCRVNTPDEDANTVVFRHPKLFGDPQPLDAVIAEFERSQGVRVRRETLPASSDEQHLFYAINLSAQSQEFDVLALDTIWAAEFPAAGWLCDLSALVTPADELDLFGAPLESATWNRRRYALPWFVDAGLLYDRKDLLDAEGLAPPRTCSTPGADAGSSAERRRVQGTTSRASLPTGGKASREWPLSRASNGSRRPNAVIGVGRNWAQKTPSLGRGSKIAKPLSD